uniref:rhodanese domain-containing protein CG4456-like n=1 Tax=Myxine glutinosa TaxID=7769 RepID=UPI00358F4110
MTLSQSLVHISTRVAIRHSRLTYSSLISTSAKYQISPSQRFRCFSVFNNSPRLLRRPAFDNSCGRRLNEQPGTGESDKQNNFKSKSRKVDDSQSREEMDSITYEQLKELMAARVICLVDVREPSEIAEHGKIPNSVNIPLSQLPTALSMDKDQFVAQYDGTPPAADGSDLVFSCFAGTRSKRAFETAIKMGFSSATYYPGGWQEWAKMDSIKSTKG